MLTCQLGPYEHISVKFQSRFKKTKTFEEAVCQTVAILFTTQSIKHVNKNANIPRKNTDSVFRNITKHTWIKCKNDMIVQHNKNFINGLVLKTYLQCLHWSYIFFNTKSLTCAYLTGCLNRELSRYAPSQWETSLHCNDVSHWLGAYPNRSLSKQCNLGLKFNSKWLNNSNTNP